MSLKIIPNLAPAGLTFEWTTYSSHRKEKETASSFVTMRTLSFHISRIIEERYNVSGERRAGAPTLTKLLSACESARLLARIVIQLLVCAATSLAPVVTIKAPDLP